MKPVTSGNLTDRHLPKELLERASLRGNEYAWPVADIPRVIEAIREANLINLGGQLQFRFADGPTCECYWVEVDPCKMVPESLPWDERVSRTAAAALRDFAAISANYDFLEEGRRNFSRVFHEVEAQAHDPREAMCFVWYAAEPGI
jgi:hypothetical protein